MSAGRFRSVDSVVIALLQTGFLLIVALPIVMLTESTGGLLVWLSYGVALAVLVWRALRVAVLIDETGALVRNPFRTYRLSSGQLTVTAFGNFPMSWLPFEAGRTNRAMVLSSGTRRVVCAATGVSRESERDRAWQFFRASGVRVDVDRRSYRP